MKIQLLYKTYQKDIIYLLEDWGISDIAVTFSEESVLAVISIQTRSSFLEDESTQRCALRISAAFLEADKLRTKYRNENPVDLITELKQILNISLLDNIESKKVH